MLVATQRDSAVLLPTNTADPTMMKGLELLALLTLTAAMLDAPWAMVPVPVAVVDKAVEVTLLDSMYMVVLAMDRPEPVSE